MERRLVVMRHAKSSWNSRAANDHDRPLNDRGRRDTPRVARRISEVGWQPQHILSSDAQRTRETAFLLLSQWEDGIGVDYTPNLYLAGPQDLQGELAGISEEVEVLLVLGHNPGWEGVVQRLSEQTIPMKTATAVLLKGSVDSWDMIFTTSWEVEEVIYAREL